MKLRVRLALSTAVLMVPLAAVLAWSERESSMRAASEILASEARTALEGDARTVCEASPEAWTRSFQRGLEAPAYPPQHHEPPDRSHGLEGARTGGAPIHFYPFDEALQPSVPFAPPLAAELSAAVRRGAAEARHRSEGPREVHEAVLLRTPWRSGPCAWVLAVRPVVSAAYAPVFVWRPWFASLVAVTLAILLVLGPTVARIRELAASVRASARRHYTDRVIITGDDEIADLARAFDEAAAEVRAHVDAQEHREQTLRDFLSNTTHDVMTPLTVLQGHLAALRDAEEAGAPADRAVLGAALREVVYMTSLVHNLGVAARLEAGEPHLVRTTLDLGRLVERCVARHGPIARQHDIELDCAVPEEVLTVDADETFLEQAIGNVVLNAIHHQRAGGHVAVVVSERGPRHFRVRVVDDGPGLSDHALAQLVDATDDLDTARARRRTGHGLGLVITRRVARLLGLTLTFARADPGGLQVDLEGPRADGGP